MRKLIALTRRELLSVYVSPLAYGTAAVFLFIFGVVFVGQFARTKLVEAGTLLDPLGYILPALLSPVLTMRLLAGEKRRGTLEMLMTAPVSDAQVVLSKFISVLIFFASLAALTLPHVFTMRHFYSGPVDWGPFFTGYLGMLLTAALFLSFGLFVSSLFESPLLAALVAFVAGLAVLMAGFLQPLFIPRSLGHRLFEFLLPLTHFQNFRRGVVDTRDVAYFVLLTVYFLFLATKVVESRKWR